MRKRISQLAFLALAFVLPVSAIGQGYYFARSDAAPTTLNTDLAAYWKLDEASGTRIDSEPTGTAMDLTDNNTVTSTTGKIGDAAQFTRANSESLTRADHADLSVGSGVSFSVTCWVYLDSKGGAGENRWIACKDNNASGTREWSLFFFTDGDRFRFFTGLTGSSSTDGVSANALGSPSLATWYFISAVHVSGGLNYISVNGGTRTSAAFTADPPDTASAFTIGAQSHGANYFDGRIDEVTFYRKALTEAEEDELYAAGAGKTCCPFP